MNEEPSAELASNKTYCHNEYQLTYILKIMLSEFNSNLNDWEDFRDMFIVVVHDDKTMLLIKKMHYLKGCLKDEDVSRLSVGYR